MSILKGFSQTPLEGNRLTAKERATVNSTGRLTFSPSAAKMMGIKSIAESELLMFPNQDGDFAVVVVQAGTANAFHLNKSGSYFYIRFKSYLMEAGIDYVEKRVIYDITKTSEQIDGHTAFLFERRILDRKTEKGTSETDDPTETTTPETAPATVSPVTPDTQM